MLTPTFGRVEKKRQVQRFLWYLPHNRTGIRIVWMRQNSGSNQWFDSGRPHCGSDLVSMKNGYLSDISVKNSYSNIREKWVDSLKNW